MKKKTWIRKCPGCKKDLVYTTERNYISSQLTKKLCVSCATKKAWADGKYNKSKTNRGQHWKLSDETRRRQSLAQKGKKLLDSTKKKLENRLRGKTYEELFGFKRAFEIKEKMSLNRRGKNNPNYNNGKKIKGVNNPMYNSKRYGNKNPFYNKKHSNISKLKMRLSSIKRIEKDRNNGNQIKPNYNPNACKIIEEYGIKNGYNFQHAIHLLCLYSVQLMILLLLIIQYFFYTFHRHHSFYQKLHHYYQQ